MASYLARFPNPCTNCLRWIVDAIYYLSMIFKFLFRPLFHFRLSIKCETKINKYQHHVARVLKQSTYIMTPSRSSKVVDFGTNRKRIQAFLLVLDSNLSAIMLHFKDIRAFVHQKPLASVPHPYYAQNFGCSPLE